MIYIGERLGVGVDPDPLKKGRTAGHGKEKITLQNYFDYIHQNLEISLKITSLISSETRVKFCVHVILSGREENTFMIRLNPRRKEITWTS